MPLNKETKSNKFYLFLILTDFNFRLSLGNENFKPAYIFGLRLTNIMVRFWVDENQNILMIFSKKFGYILFQMFKKIFLMH